MIPGPCWGGHVPRHLTPFVSLLRLGISCRSEFNDSPLQGETHLGLTIGLALDFHYILNYLFYKCGRKKKKNDVSGSHRMLGNIRVDMWVRSS